MNKRQEIIETTAGMIETSGYENTKISDILEACNIGKGQFYYYFSSKRELGLAVINYFFTSFHQNVLQTILGSQKQPEDKLTQMLEWIVALHESKQAKCGCIFGNLALEMSEHDEGFRESLNSVFTQWASALRLVMEEMFPPSVDSCELEKLAQTIVAMIEGGIMLMKSNQNINVLKDICHWIRYLVDSFRTYGPKQNIMQF